MKIYFAGSIRGGREDALVYFDIIDYLKTDHTVLTEHLGSKELSAQGELEKKEDFVFRRDIEWLDSSDLVVAEVTQPSLGVGYELAYAESRNIPVICLFRLGNERLLSSMIRGNKYFQVIDYHDLEDLKPTLHEALVKIEIKH